jgi:hypothetical protein
MNWRLQSALSGILGVLGLFVMFNPVTVVSAAASYIPWLLLLAALGVLLLVDGISHISVIEVIGTMLVVESLLRRRLVSLLAGWTPAAPGLGDVVEQGAEFRMYDTEESALPAGEFLARFSILAIGPNGGPWSA